MKKWVKKHLVALFVILIAIESGQAQTKIMEYKTELTFEGYMPREDNPNLEGLWPLGEVTQIGSEFIAVAVSRERSRGEVLYIFDLKKNKLAMKLDDAVGADYGSSNYRIIPSGATRSFFLRRTLSSSMDEKVEFYKYINKQRRWVLGEMKLAGPIGNDNDMADGYSWTTSIPLAPGYFVKTIKGSDGKLEIHIFQF